MRKEFKLVKLINQNIQIRFLIIYIVSILIVIYSISIEKNNPKLSNVFKWISLISFLLTGFIHLFRSFVVKDYTITGSVTFDNFTICIKENSDSKIFNLLEVNNLKISYSGYAGKMDSFYKSFYTEDGSANLIRFKYNDTKYEYRFLIQDKKSELWLYQYIDYLVKGGVKLFYHNSYNMLKSRRISKLNASS
jgi:hypothetical protein